MALYNTATGLTNFKRDILNINNTLIYTSNVIYTNDLNISNWINTQFLNDDLNVSNYILGTSNNKKKTILIIHQIV